MNEIGTIGNSHPALARIAAKRAAATQQAQPGGKAPAPADTAQFSMQAQLLSKLAGLPDVREDVVAQAKANIEAGVYDSDEVINTTIDKMLEDN